MRKRTAALAFRLICLLFSAVLAVSTLLTGIDLTAAADRISRQSSEIAALEKENESLRAELACALSMEELEDYATRVLGMQPCGAEQIIVIESGEDR